MTVSDRVRAAVSRLRRAGSASAVQGAEPPTAAWVAEGISPWSPIDRTHTHTCVICRWSGDGFIGGAHSEMAACPRCGSVARDRFLFWCFVNRSPELLRCRLLETSPRLGGDYREAMATWFQYVCSDYDESAHRGTVRLDLQAIELPDDSIDVILTPHVLEHVPQTDDALAEIARVLAPGGRMYLQVPLLQGVTAPPSQPEFHGDNTPVFWRFGFDLTVRLRSHGFQTRLLCTDDWLEAVHAGRSEWPTATSGEFDVASMLAHVIPDDLTSVADAAACDRFGFVPSYMFLTWECFAP